MAAWTWWYGIKSPGYAVRTPPDTHTSEWLSQQRPITPAERDQMLRAYTTPSAPSWAPPGAAADPAWQEPLYTHAWWTTYDEQLGAWAPWTRYHNPDTAGCDTGATDEHKGPFGELAFGLNQDFILLLALGGAVGLYVRATTGKALF